MQLRQLTTAFATACAIGAAAATPAHALTRTLGSVTQPAGASPQQCAGGGNDAGSAFFQATETAASYTVPESGVLTSWSTAANVLVDADNDGQVDDPSDVPPGTTTRLVVLRPSGTAFTVQAVDTRALPPLAERSAAGVATFPLSTPIAVQSGDRLALGATQGVCFFIGSAFGAAQINIVANPSPLAAGQTATPSNMSSPPGFQINLAAELRQPADLAATVATDPAATYPGQVVALTAAATNPAAVSSLGKLTVDVPAGLAVVGAAVDDGDCAAAGQRVTCTATVPAAGASDAVVLVRPAAAGAFPFTATIAGDDDANAANDTATGTLTVSAPPVAAGGSQTPQPVTTPPATTRQCVVPTLKNVPAKLVPKLLRQLRCKAGKAKRARSKSVRKGLVIRTSPGAGTYTAGRKVTYVVSSGKPKRKRGKR